LPLKNKDIISICSKEQIQRYIQNIANQIDIRYKDFKNIHLICILDGALVFTKALEKQIKKYNINISYIKISATQNMSLKNQASLIDKNLIPQDKFNSQTIHIILDDLIDSGKSMTLAKKYLKSLKYKNISTIALFNKYKNINKADIIGHNFEYEKDKLEKIGIKDYWLFGYGMDLDKKYRDLEEIKAVVINI
jgi:hypoxanthine phosphoribosyltransferase